MENHLRLRGVLNKRIVDVITQLRVFFSWSPEREREREREREKDGHEIWEIIGVIRKVNNCSRVFE